MVNPFISSWQIYRTLIIDGMLYLRTHKKTWLPLLSCCITIVLYLLILPFALQQLVDQAQSVQTSQFKTHFFILMLGAVALSTLVGVYHIACHLFSQSIVSVLFNNLFYYFIFQSPFYHAEGTQSVFERHQQDIDKIRRCLKVYLPDIVVYFLLTMSSFIMIWLVSPSLTAVTLLALGVLVLMILFSRRYDRTPQHQAQQLQQEEIDFIASHLNAITTTQAFNQQDRSLEGLSQIQSSHEKQYQQLCRTKGIFLGIATLMTCCLLLGVLWYGYFMSAHDKLSTGELIQYICYVMYIVFALRKLFTTQQKMFSVGQSYFNLKTLFTTPSAIQSPLIADTLSTTDKGLSVQCEDISFSYQDKQSYPALNNISLLIKEGECIAIEGPQGAGKSTLLHLLLRFIDPTQGSIYFNQTDIRWLSLTTLRQHIGYVPQQTFLFAGTVLDNMRFGQSFYAEEQVIQLTRTLGIEASINALKNGFNTIVQSDEDIPQWLGYLISLVRALHHHPSLLLIDEITNTLDPESEAFIYHTIQQAMKSQTTLIVTHHHPTMQLCDRILRLEHGQMIAFDTYQNLSNKS